MSSSAEGYAIQQQPLPRRTDEEIIMEATCDGEHLTEDNCVKCCYAPFLQGTAGGYGIITILCWCAIAPPIGWLCGRRVAKSWTLQLTKTAVHHKRKHHLYLCSSFDTNVSIDLDDIDSITIEETRVEKWWCCFLSDSYPTTVCLLLKPGRRQDLFATPGLLHCCILHCGCLEDAQMILKFPHCLDAEEFVQKVKQQMQCNAES
jgi:hypothetical protein